MQRATHRFPIFLLVALLLTWGTCPCVLASMLGLRGGDEAAGPGEPVRAVPAAPC